MAFSDYQPERRAVTVKGQELGQVQGLSLESLATLVQTHLPDMEAVVEIFDRNNAGQLVTAQEWLKLAVPLISQAPGLAANIIAIAGDEPTAAPMIQKWPGSVQAAALFDIFELTFSEVGQVKKLVGLIATIKQTSSTPAKKTAKRATKIPR